MPMLEQTATTRALVVEDDPNIVDLIRSNLAVRGFDTVVSVDGLRALNLLETEEPDIVLLDLMLPEVDGFELCQLIRERSPGSPRASPASSTPPTSVRSPAV